MSMQVMRFAVRTSLLAAMALAVACSTDSKSGTTGEAEEEGKATGSICPPASTLTYENFTKPFAEKYCTRCHSSQLKGDARNGAPLGHDFDSEEGIIFVGHHVDENAAAGPDSVNTVMPPVDPRPTEDERRKLGEWLACHVPADAGPEI